ncbi:hypothetical protein ABZ235_14900 [Streptomyces canus]|uniref:hypothetical protein n=1 Tax=Streptomyces canus TaxID=58343 RepID=UPI0033BC476C
MRTRPTLQLEPADRVEHVTRFQFDEEEALVVRPGFPVGGQFLDTPAEHLRPTARALSLCARRLRIRYHRRAAPGCRFTN